MSTSSMTKRTSATGRRRRFSASHTISSSSVETVIRRADSPNALLEPRARAARLRTRSPQDRQGEASKASTSPGSPGRKRRLSVVEQTVSASPERKEEASNLHRWSQSTVSSVASSGRNRRASFSKRISIPPIGPLSAAGKLAGSSAGADRGQSTLGGLSQPSVGPLRPPDDRSLSRSPSRNVLEKRRRPITALYQGSVGSTDPLPPPSDGLLPAVTLSVLSEAIDDTTSPAISPTPSPATQSVLESDYFGATWRGKSPQKRMASTNGLENNTSSHPGSWRQPASSDGLRALEMSNQEALSSSDASLAEDRRLDRVRPEEEGMAIPHRANHSQSPSAARRRERTREKGYRPPSQKSMLAKALEQANTAVLLDNAHNFEGAIDAYGDACALLQQVMVRTVDDEDRRKLDDVRRSYKNRIDELKNIPPQERGAGKALPARPGSGSSHDLDSSRSSLSNASDESAVIEIASVHKIANGRLQASGSRSPAAVEIPKRRESLMPSSLNNVEDFIFSASPLPLPGNEAWAEPSIRRDGRLTSINLQMPMNKAYMPPPLSPRRPSSPAMAEVGSGGRSIRAEFASDSRLLPPPLERQHSRADSTETTSWLDTIDESGGSSASSVHSRSSSVRRRPAHARPASGTTEAEFDAALDAAVEAAYNEGLEPEEIEPPIDLDLDVGIDVGLDLDFDGISDAKRNVELAKERVREAEREAAIFQATKDEKQEYAGYTNHDRNDYASLGDVDRETEEEERFLEEMTRGFIMDDFEFDSQSKSALPRQSDSSGFSGRTWGSSIGSNPTTAGTSLQTLPEVPIVSRELMSQSPPPPPLPPPSGALPAPPTAPLAPLTAGRPAAPSCPPSLPDPLSQGVRGRRLSRLSVESLTIDVGKRHTPGDTSIQTQPIIAPRATKVPEHTVVPLPPKTTSAIPDRSMEAAVSSMPDPALATNGAMRKMSSPLPGTNLSTAPPGLLKFLHIENDHNPMLPGSRAGPPSQLSNFQAEYRSIRKNLSSSSLKNRNLSVSSPDGSDISPSTPTTFTFAGLTTNSRKGPMPSIPPLPSPALGIGTINSMPSGGLHLFVNDLHSPDSPGIPNQLARNPPAPLEPCPTDPILRPFWLMRCLYQTMAHPCGGYLSTKLFIPRHAWQVKGVKLKAVDEKISNCDFLTAALLKLGGVDTCDADAVLEEMQSLEAVLDQVQSTLSKKLGSEVGLQGSNMWLRESPNGSEQPSNTESGSTKSTNSSNKSYLSWKRLKPKSSGVGLTSTLPTSKDSSKDGPTLNSLPMTPNLSTLTTKRDVNQLQFTGPNAVYMSALARLFDAAQVLDPIARQVEDPGLKHSSSTHVGLELSARHAAEFFAFYICRFALTDVSMMLDKFIKRGSEWVLA